MTPMTPRDQLELHVLEATGDPETAERAGMLAALVVEVHAEVIAEIVGVPAETFVNEFWGAVL